jgi:hypothetical protein
MAMTAFEKNTAALSRLTKIDAYSDAGAARKETFHRTGKAWLRQLAKQLGMAPSTFGIRSNLGGIAVSGEVTLHAETLYVQLSESCLRPGISAMYRSCMGRKDYSGGANHFADLKDLTDPRKMTAFQAEVKRLAGLAP